MKNVLINIILAAIIVLLVFFMIGQARKQNRIYDNFKESIEKSNTKYYDLTRSEFRQLEKTLTDSLYLKIKDSLNLKIKHIERTIEHKYTYTYDTTKTLLITHENDNNLYFDKQIDKCLSISGRVADSVIYFDKVTIDYDARTVYYWQRKHKVIGIPFGKKQYFGITVNNCTGQTEVIEIKIGKR